MSRIPLLIAGLVCLSAFSGCSCFGPNSGRPSFMEFRNDGCFNRRQHPPMPATPACGAPACAPCGAPSCEPCSNPAPCCEGGEIMSSPAIVPTVSDPGTFS